MATPGLEEWRTAAPQDLELIKAFSPAERYLPTDVTLFATPGHTRAHHSLRAQTKHGCLVIAGDAAMTIDFFAASEGFHNSVDFIAARESIQSIRNAADIVVPGHGNYFITKHP
jgi:glyoxylase-like metal-dependent hydrolase (beta-lactamase superfamily II)